MSRCVQGSPRIVVNRAHFTLRSILVLLRNRLNCLLTQFGWAGGWGWGLDQLLPYSVSCFLKGSTSWTSFVVQWLRLCLAMQGARV